MCDFYAISRHDKDPFANDFGIEIKACEQAIAYLRDSFKRIPILFKIGNHEERWEKYLLSKAPELTRLDNMALSALLKLKNYGVKVIEKPNDIIANGLVIVHGHEKIRSGGKNPAQKLFNQVKHSAVCGHLHRSSTYRWKGQGGWDRCYTVGALCNLTPQYAPSNQWNHGFAVVHLDGDSFNLENLEIIDHKVFNV